MKKEYKIPELNTIQMKQIIKHLKENKEFNRKKDMDNLAQQFTEVLMLNGLDNAECSYVLLNTQRHLMSLQKNRETLKKVGVDINDLDLDGLGYITITNANVYRSRVDSNGKPHNQ